MRVVVLGACGMLGRDVVDSLLAWGTLDVTALCHDDCDITSRMDVLAAVEGEHGKADVVINCAAYTDVDGAEADPSSATLVNAYGPWNIVQVLRGTGIKFIHISTDYVFDGESPVPYAEGAFPRPLNAYGRSKLDGEEAVGWYEYGFIVRSAWLYGESRCFPRTMLQLARYNDTLKVVVDQRGTPTWTRELARYLTKLAILAHDNRVQSGVYHCVSQDATTWYDLAVETFRLAGLDVGRLKAVSSTEFPRPAVRPANSVLTSVRVSQSALPQLPGWRLQLQLAFDAGIFDKI